MRPWLTLRAQGDATYLIVKDDGTLADYGLNAVCTHLGCVVPWNKAENKFKCPCHGSQYNAEGKVIRGPAPLVRAGYRSRCLMSASPPPQSLALAHLTIAEDDTVLFSPWTETDFRCVAAALMLHAACCNHAPDSHARPRMQHRRPALVEVKISRRTHAAARSVKSMLFSFLSRPGRGTLAPCQRLILFFL